ncbi:MAG: RNA-binding protein [Planctomycetes bacterium]|nr:RNA-binding protein [Planctomycetota bacterium]
MSRIYVGNLAKNTTEDSVRSLVAQDGRTVTKVQLKMDAETGRSRGFAFVDLGTPEEATAAIAALNGATLDGATLKVNVAKDLPVPRRPASPGMGYGGRPGGGKRW